MKVNLMAHLVAGYPTQKASLEAARALARGGATYLEVQFPFSDPSADGPAIQAACTQALAAGFKVAKGWELVSVLRQEFPSIPIFVMSYASIVVARGVEAFVAEAARHSVGLIIPDLIPGADEGLFEAGRMAGVPIVPVIVPTVAASRLNELLALKPEWVYTAIRTGITGIHTTLTPDLEFFLSGLHAQTKVLAGFGIDSPDQVRALAPRAHAVVVGSAFVRTLSQAWGEALPEDQRLTLVAQRLTTQARSLSEV